MTVATKLSEARKRADTYQALRAFGFGPKKAAEIALGAKRGDGLAQTVVRAAQLARDSAE